MSSHIICIHTYIYMYMVLRSYDKERMLDDDLLSTWTANCRTGFYETDTDFTNCRGAQKPPTRRPNLMFDM